MQRGVNYLYECDGGEKVQNVGFAKVLMQNEKCRIHIRGNKIKEKEVELYFLQEGKDGARKVFVDNLLVAGGQLDCIVDYERKAELLQGILLQGQNKIYVAGEMEEEEDEYIQPRDIKYEKIQRKDLVRLPRKEWQLANNNFLLHGFYNYHHLLWMEEGGRKWIGVPGIYHEKEVLVAKAFGFGEFYRVLDTDLELEEEERNLEEDFGYWRREIHKEVTSF